MLKARITLLGSVHWVGACTSCKAGTYQSKLDWFIGVKN